MIKTRYLELGNYYETDTGLIFRFYFVDTESDFYFKEDNGKLHRYAPNRENGTLDPSDAESGLIIKELPEKDYPHLYTIKREDMYD